MMRFSAEDDNETRRFIGVWLTVVASLCYCYYATGSLPKGKLRLLSLLPIFCLFAVLPLSLSTILAIGVTTFITWLTSLKLLLFAFDRGPLSFSCTSQYRCHSLLAFILIACFPINIFQNRIQVGRRSEKPILPHNMPSKLLLLGLFLLVLDHKHSLLEKHPMLICTFYSCMVYLFDDLVVGISNSIVQPILGVELDRPSDEPYLSTSLQDFWGRRWNLTVGNTLHQTVYLPIKSFLLPLVGSASWVATMVAVLAVFLVSGLMHEHLYYYMTRARPTWEVTWLFVLHGVCMVVEVGVKAAAKRKGWKTPPVAILAPLTVGFMLATTAWLFYPPIRRSGTDVKVVNELRALIGVALKFGKRLRV